MKVLLQRVAWAEVAVEPETPAQSRYQARIEQGLLLLVGIGKGDAPETVRKLARKVTEFRIFNDTAGKMNLDVKEAGGAVLAISQFTLYADTSKGRRPSFTNAEAPERAKQLFDQFCTELRAHGLMVETGVFGAHMKVSLLNDGPVTILLEETAAAAAGGESGAGKIPAG